MYGISNRAKNRFVAANYYATLRDIAIFPIVAIGSITQFESIVGLES